jgi:hypothetical protein
MGRLQRLQRPRYDLVTLTVSTYVSRSELEALMTIYYQRSW